MKLIKDNVEEWAKPFVACILGMTSGIDLSPGHFIIAARTATIALVLGIVIKKVKQ